MKVPVLQFMDRPKREKKDGWKYAFRDETQYGIWRSKLGDKIPRHTKLTDITTGQIYVKF